MISSKNKLVIAISSSALFNLREANNIYQTQGLEAYEDYQLSKEHEFLDKGPAFQFVKKILSINLMLDYDWAEVILLSRNSLNTGLRIFNSIEHYELDITRAVFTSGEKPWKYVEPLGCELFLSSNEKDVKQALDNSIAAATLLPHQSKSSDAHQSQLRIAFDGDAVIFSDDSEKIFQTKGLEQFKDHEKHYEKKPMNSGPFTNFLSAISLLQQQLEDTHIDPLPIRTALVTARSAPTHKRVINTLRHWNIRIDESFFLGGLDKKAFLEAFQADIFFDDQKKYCTSASEKIPSAHVPTGIINQPNEY